MEAFLKTFIDYLFDYWTNQFCKLSSLWNMLTLLPLRFFMFRITWIPKSKKKKKCLYYLVLLEKCEQNYSSSLEISLGRGLGAAHNRFRSSGWYPKSLPIRQFSYFSGWNRFTNTSIFILTTSDWQVHSVARFPYSTHLGVAKFVDSAILNPWLKPAWYPKGKVIMISPWFCVI